MFKKVLLAATAVGFVIYQLAVFEELQSRTPVIPVAEIDALLRQWPNLSVEERVSFKMLLYKHGIIDEERWFNFEPIKWEALSTKQKRAFKNQYYLRKY